MDLSTVSVKILFFAQSREIVGSKESSIIVPKTTTYADLLESISVAFGLSSIKNNILIAKNTELCADHGEDLITFESNDELAIIPPLSGG